MWDEIRQEAITHLQNLIRFNTTNPPGNEQQAAEYVATVLSQAGVETQVLDFAPGRGSAVARLRGSGAAAPLLCMSHLDVVPARPEEWQHDPFGGEVVDGYIWGRGAVDTKNTAAIQLMAMLLISRMGLPLKRDLLLAAMADEEVGGRGAHFLATEHPEWVRAEYAFNEAGGEAFVVGGKRIYTFQVAQKGGLDLRMIGHGRPGHSSVPYDESAISDLAEAIIKLKQHQLPHRVINTTRRFFNGMAEVMDDSQLAQALRDVLDPARQGTAITQLGVDNYTSRMFGAMMRNIAEPTIVKAGYKSNVMPATAEATISTRGLPGVSREELLDEVRQVVGDKVELAVGEFHAGLEFDLPDDDPLLLAAGFGIQKWDPEGIVLPYLVCGGTDAMYLAPLGTQVVGFVPMRPDPAGSMLQLAHSNQERLAVDNLLFGVQVLFDTICHLNGINPTKT
ncbi:MAG: M20/M25/M40 family metallo-hydrolase [Chloroflexi bacterium]|nr:M20/M25/M40 family metallo-hydrolase [Chloroflexota bacterium]